MRRSWILLLAAVLCLTLLGCGGDADGGTPVLVLPTEPTEETVNLGDVVILYTGGLHGAFAQDEAQGQIGYAALTEYRKLLEDEGRTVILVDGGDALGIEGAGAVDGGETLLDIIDAVCYDIRVPGTLELSYDLDAFGDLTADRGYISCNLLEAATGEPVFDTYAMIEINEINVGFVGITAPAAVDGYSFCEGTGGEELYDAVQKAIDDAVDAGAEYVIAVANTGTNPDDSPWTSAEIIANTTGLSAFLDCGSGSVLDGDVVVDMDDFEIPVCAVGESFHYVGQVTLELSDGSVNVQLLDVLGEEDSQVKVLTDDLSEALEEIDAATEPAEETTETTEDTEE